MYFLVTKLDWWQADKKPLVLTQCYHYLGKVRTHSDITLQDCLTLTLHPTLARHVCWGCRRKWGEEEHLHMSGASCLLFHLIHKKEIYGHVIVPIYTWSSNQVTSQGHTAIPTEPEVGPWTFSFFSLHLTVPYYIRDHGSIAKTSHHKGCVEIHRCSRISMCSMVD